MKNVEFLVSYETEIINNGVFYTDSNGLGLIERSFMEQDVEYGSDTISLASNLYPVTSLALIKDELNKIEVGVVVDRPTFATSHFEGQLLFSIGRFNDGKDQRSKINPVNEVIFPERSEL
jgi:hypothetical protein